METSETVYATSTTNDFLAQNATNLKQVMGCNSAENDTNIEHAEIH
jgi:hypothetical protein